MSYEELKKLAEAATPGPWCAAGPSFGAPLPVTLDSVVQEGADGPTICRDVESPDDCQYIAAASPDVILKLIAERDAMYESLKALLAEIENYQTINLLNGYDNLSQVNARAALALVGEQT